MNRAPLILAGLAVLSVAAYLVYKNQQINQTPAQSASYGTPSPTSTNSPTSMKSTLDSIQEAAKMCQSGVKTFETASYKVECKGFPK